MCSAAFILRTTYWAANMVRCGCSPGVTYSIVFGIGYGLCLGFFLGVASGSATGITVAIELHRAGRTHDHYPLPWEALFSAIRGVAFGAGLYRVLGLQYAVTFG